MRRVAGGGWRVAVFSPPATRHPPHVSCVSAWAWAWAFSAIAGGGADPGGVVNLTVSANPSLFDQLITFTATVSPKTGPVYATGTVTFLDAGTSIGHQTLNASGQATFASSALLTDNGMFRYYTPAGSSFGVDGIGLGTPTLTAYTVVWADAFADTTGTNLLSHANLIGSTIYSAITGAASVTATIQSNKLQTGSDGVVNMAAIPTSSSNVRMNMLAHTDSGWHGVFGLLGRVTDSNNYVGVIANRTVGTLAVVQVTGGVTTTLDSIGWTPTRDVPDHRGC